MRERIPPDIVHILRENAFCTESSILNIDRESIDAIEEYTNENRAILKNTSFGIVYALLPPV